METHRLFNQIIIRRKAHPLLIKAALYNAIEKEAQQGRQRGESGSNGTVDENAIVERLDAKH